MNLSRSLIVISWSNTHFISLSPFLSHFFCSLKSLCFFLSFPLCTFCLILQSELHYIAISCFLFNVFHVWLLPKQIFANFCNFRATRNRQICCFFFWHWTRKIYRANTTQQIGASNPFAGINSRSSSSKSSSSCKQTNPAQKKYLVKNAKRAICVFN